MIKDEENKDLSTIRKKEEEEEEKERIYVETIWILVLPSNLCE